MECVFCILHLLRWNFIFEIHNIDLYTFKGRDEFQIVKISDSDKNFHQGRDRKLPHQSNRWLWPWHYFLIYKNIYNVCAFEFQQGNIKIQHPSNGVLLSRLLSIIPRQGLLLWVLYSHVPLWHGHLILKTKSWVSLASYKHHMCAFVDFFLELLSKWNVDV